MKRYLAIGLVMAAIFWGAFLSLCCGGCTNVIAASGGTSAAATAHTLALSNTTAADSSAAVDSSCELVVQLYKASTRSVWEFLGGKTFLVSPSYPGLAQAAAFAQRIGAQPASQPLTETQKALALAMLLQNVADLQGEIAGQSVPLVYAPPKTLAAARALAPQKRSTKAIPTWLSALWAKLPAEQQAAIQSQVQASLDLLLTMAQAEAVAYVNGLIAGDPYVAKAALYSGMTVDQVLADHSTDTLAENAKVQQDAARMTDLKNAGTQLATTVIGAIVAALSVLF